MVLKRLWNRLKFAEKSQKFRLCFLFAASPNDGFFSQIAMFRLSLDRLGGIYASAHIVVVFGDNEFKPLPERWKTHFERIETYWVTSEEFQKNSYLAQGDARWSYISPDVDFFIFADADILLIRSITDLLELLVDSPAVAGTIAGVPFPQFPKDNPLEKWASLARQFIGREISLDYTHTLASEKTEIHLRKCPYYVNYGFVIFPYSIAAEIRETYLEFRPRVALELYNPYFAGQVAMTLAIYKHNVTCRAIPLKYNFFNDVEAEKLHAQDMEDIRVIHYLRKANFDRQKIFTSPEEFKHFLSLELSGSEKIFQNYIRHLTDTNYPFQIL